jgi:cbb3-type cytochrome oxidase subunit 1
MGVRFIKIAGVYFLIAVLLGLTMGIIHNFSFTSVHAHLNLLGWVSMAIFGIIYVLFPKAGTTKLAKTHFWLHNIGLPVMQVALFVQLVTNNEALIPVTIVGSLLVVVGVILYVINLVTQIKADQVIGSNKDFSA